MSFFDFLFHFFLLVGLLFPPSVIIYCMCADLNENTRTKAVLLDTYSIGKNFFFLFVCLLPCALLTRFMQGVEKIRNAFPFRFLSFPTLASHV